MSTKQTEERVREITSFIEALTARFRRTNRRSPTVSRSPTRTSCCSARSRAAGRIIRALGGRFGVPVSTMTCLVHRMEKKGLVRRVRHREDRRAIELEATPTGALVLREHGRAMEAIARGMLEALSERDQDALITILRRVHRAFAREGREAEAG
jgi:DNA-binding MarR family transcriptional regulator